MSDVPCCPITHLPQYIWPVLYNNYSQIHGYSDSLGCAFGESIGVVFQKLAVVGKEAAEGIRQAFSFLSRESGEDWPGPEAYLETAQYVERGRDSEVDNINIIWENIKNVALSRTRYFNTNIENILRDLFSDIHSTKTADAMGLVRTLKAGARLYRARVALNAAQLRAILLNPTKELGPPPGSMAKAGRMNASGIALFYGAFEPETCLAEVRPPVGSQVVIGAFALRRAVHLLDLTFSDKIELVADPFSENYEEERLRWAFRRSLGTRMAKPVMPGSETADYIPTQLVCEFISQFLEPKFDGIVYPSSQSNDVGNNVALFFESSAVQPWDDSLKLDFSVSTAEDDETIDLYSVRLEAPDVVDRLGWIIGGSPPATLSLLKSTIVVGDVKAVKYRTRMVRTDYSQVRKPTTLRFRK